ncbi:MAG: hypothetical protein ACKVZH_06715 [Blastocatellia bacterium]
MKIESPFPVVEEPDGNSTASTTSSLRATGSVEPTKPQRAPGRKASQPRAKKPKLRTVAGTYWRADGDGYELRKSGGKDDPDKDKYLGRLSGKRYGQMKADFGKQLPVALTEWVKAKAAEKGIDL